MVTESLKFVITAQRYRPGDGFQNAEESKVMHDPVHCDANMRKPCLISQVCTRSAEDKSWASLVERPRGQTGSRRRTAPKAFETLRGT